MPNYKLIKLNKWKEKPSPKICGRGSGWCNELNLALIDSTKNYCVLIRKVQTDWGEVEHACMRNKDGSDIPWAEKQRIKNELFGPDITAIEVFPAESNLVDEANMYHLWVLPQGYKLPFSL